ncbi:MAG TPA: AMP-binding protein [Pseudonocardia sp.]|jgi:acyl-CoA synthetase (AMP-forming)/AMP-acid ligase II|nr:AMP-binding protein [Pseudonocardia sp.]
MSPLLLWTWITDEVRHRYESGGQWTSRTWLDDLLDWHSAAPGDVAVIDGTTRCTVADVVDRARRVAGFLRERGVGRGDVVSMIVPNWWEFTVVHAATAMVGAVVNPLLPSLGRADIAHILTTGGAKVVFAAGSHRGSEVIAVVRAAVAEAGCAVTVVGIRSGDELDLECILRAGTADERVDALAGDADSLLFTSGTEALPKGAVHTHQTSYYGLRTYLDEVLGLPCGSPVFMPSPICHATGLQWGLRAASHVRGALVLQDRWDPSVALDLVTGHGCAYTLAATPFIADLVAEQRRRGATGSPFTAIVSGGAPIPRHLVSACADVLGAPLLSVFGATETYVTTANRPGDPPELLATDGCPLPGTELAIRPDGEITARGPHVFAGYLDPERTRAAFDGEWYRFGDLGTIDASGALTVNGRIKDIVIRGGQNIAVREVEELLIRHSAVEEVAVVGYPDERLGERCCAVVVAAPGPAPTLPGLVDYLLAQGIARYKLPERLVLREAMPRTATGKIRKAELRAALGS